VGENNIDSQQLLKTPPWLWFAKSYLYFYTPFKTPGCLKMAHSPKTSYWKTPLSPRVWNSIWK